jgi:hypothetical protein
MTLIISEENYRIELVKLQEHLKSYTTPLSSSSGGTSSPAGGGGSSSGGGGGRRKVKKTSTVVSTNTNRPIIVNSQSVIDEYKRLYGNSLGNTEFIIRRGQGAIPPTTNLFPFAEQFSNFLKEEKSKGVENIKIKTVGGFQLGNGGDITEDLFKILKNLNTVLSKPIYKAVTPIVITGGNDAYHQGKPLNPNSTYGINGVLPYTTTHTRGLAIDVRSVNADIDNLIIDALEEAGFTGILWHNPPHIHANIQ